jgi:hypothetical protein
LYICICPGLSYPMCLGFLSLSDGHNETKEATYWMKSASSLDEALIGGVEPVTFLAPPLEA